jgi:hypothetical protein
MCEAFSPLDISLLHPQHPRKRKKTGVQYLQDNIGSLVNIVYNGSSSLLVVSIGKEGMISRRLFDND